MLLEFDFNSDTPIYLQLKNQIIIAIANSTLKAGEKLPTVRSLADESGINVMTVSKAYQLLKKEGYIITDRRSGATVANINGDTLIKEENLKDLKLIISKLKLDGMNEEDFIKTCLEYFKESN